MSNLDFIIIDEMCSVDGGDIINNRNSFLPIKWMTKEELEIMYPPRLDIMKVTNGELISHYMTQDLNNRNLLDNMLSPIFEKIRRYYSDKQIHALNYAKWRDGNTSFPMWPIMTKKQAFCVVEAGIVKKEDLVNWDELIKWKNA